MAIESLGEHSLAERLGPVGIHLVKACAEERRLVHFDHEGAHVGCVRVMVSIEVAKLGFDKGVGQSFEAFGGAEPGKAIG